MNVLPVLFRKNDSLDISASDVGSLGRLPVSAFLPNSHLLTWSWLTTRILTFRYSGAGSSSSWIFRNYRNLFQGVYFYGLSENKPIPILSFQCGLSHFDESILRLKEISRGRRWSFIKHNKVEWSSYKTKVKILISFFVQKLCPLILILMSNWLPYSRYSDELVFIILPILSLLCNTILPYKDRRILTVIDGNLTNLIVKWLARHFFNWV